MRRRGFDAFPISDTVWVDLIFKEAAMDYVATTLTVIERSFGKPRKTIDLDALHRAYGREKSVPALVKACAQTIFTAGMPLSGLACIALVLL